MKDSRLMECKDHAGSSREPSFAPCLILLAAALVLAGFNRLSPWTACPVAGFDGVRLKELLAMFALTPLLAEFFVGCQ